MTQYLIKLTSCHDSTTVVLGLDDAEAAAVRKLAEAAAAASEYECQPTFSVARACAAPHPDDCPNGPEPHAFVPADDPGMCCCRGPWEDAGEPTAAGAS